MAHFVAKELGIRPYQILTEWTVEELMVAYGEYANIHARESYEMMSPKERAKKRVLPTDRWAVKFISLEDALNMQKNGLDESTRRQNEIDLQEMADMLL